MFQGIKDRLEIARLQRQRRELERTCDQAAKAAHAEGNRAEVVRREFADEIEMIVDEIHQVQTRMLTRKAELLFVSVPDYEDESMWQSSRLIGGFFLTRKGISELRSAVRKEQKERWDFWAGRLAAGTGLVGTLIGLVSVLRK